MRVFPFNSTDTEEMPRVLQRGGKLLDSGLYGCAFDPPLVCSTSKKKANKPSKDHRVGKVLDKEGALHEYSISHQLQDIQGADQYFILVDEVCSLAPMNQQTDPDIRECMVFKTNTWSDIRQISMPFGGKTLFSLPRNVSSIHFKQLGQHLLEAGTLLLTKQVVHGDLHSKNILMDSNGRGRLIDFGLAWSPQTLTLASVRSLDRVFNPAISQEPPEVSIWNGLLDGFRMPQILARIQDQKTGVQLVSKLYNQPISQLMGYLRRFVETTRCFQTQDRFAFYRLYWSKIDAWGFGTLLLSLFVELSMDPAFERQTGFDDLLDMVLRVCKGLLMMDAGLRWDAAEALRVWEPNSAVLQRPEVQTWLQQQDHIRAELTKKLDGLDSSAPTETIATTTTTSA